MTRKMLALEWVRWGGRGAMLLVFSAGVVVLLLYLAGKFSPKVATDIQASPPAVAAGQTAAARYIRLPLTESAVGTIRAVHETTLRSKLMASVVEVNLKAGQQVQEGQVLVRLDDTDLRARLQQAKAALASAEAAQAQAADDERRYGKLIQTRSVSQQEYEKVKTQLHSADANLLRAQEAVKEVQAMLDWATVRSPITGIVNDKKVEEGDTATPGQTLATLFDPTRMQLVASVRESLAHRLAEGQSIQVRVEGLDKQCSGTISEIVPEAQSASRSFQVKVTGPCPTGIYTGMFGRLLIPLQEEDILVIPRKAVRNIGQLELVDVLSGGQVARRAIRTGRTFGEEVEVLSGIQQGEQVVLSDGEPTAAQEASHG